MFEVNFSNKLGLIKPLHGVNNGPVSYGNYTHLEKEYAEAGIPFVRLHDTDWPNPRQVDIAKIFPNFDADANNPSSYKFEHTDDIISSIFEVGAEPIYRLGTSIEHTRVKTYVHPPLDFEKWAEICIHIIMHYNEKWVNGFEYGIKHWEIWNEPEDCDGKRDNMWTGTKAQYFRLYEVASNAIKKRFPDIKVGGYASCGFYAITNEQPNDFHDSFLKYFTDFLNYITSEEHKSPLDFFTWHLYSGDIGSYVKHSRFVKDTLEKYGLGDIESILDEWNYTGEGGYRAMREAVGGALCGAALCEMQNGCVDIANYYDGQPHMIHCGLFNLYGECMKPFYAFKSFNALYRLGGKQAEVKCDLSDIYTIAAVSDNGEAYIMAVNYRGVNRLVEIDVNGIDLSKNAELLITDSNCNMESAAIEKTDKSLKLELNKNTVALIHIN